VDKNKIAKLGNHILSGLKIKKKIAIIIAKGNLVICSAICCAKYLKNGFKGWIRYGDIFPKSESSSKLNTTQTTENCLTKKAHKKYLESMILLMLIDSLRLLLVHIFNIKKGIIPDIAHSAISTLYSSIFEYWTFNKVNTLLVIKLDIIVFFY
jgi:hypothetical protein